MKVLCILHLNLKSHQESKSKPITILPSNRCNPAQSIPISPYDYSAPIYSNTNNSPASFYVPNVIQVSPLPDDQIDSALVSAISNPRERMVLFHIENSILDFVKSK